MKKFITEKFAISGLLISLSALVTFHLLILFSAIPFKIVWGDRLKDQAQMLTFEIVSVIINLIMIAIVGIKGGLIKVNVNRIIMKSVLWIDRKSVV